MKTDLIEITNGNTEIIKLSEEFRKFPKIFQVCSFRNRFVDLVEQIYRIWKTIKKKLEILQQTSSKIIPRGKKSSTNYFETIKIN